MATTGTQTVDVAQVLASLLETVDGLRVYEYVPDTFRPPGVVLGQPLIDFADQGAGFCSATWTYPCNVITARANERGAQRAMSKLLLDIVSALSADVDGVFSIEPQDARPIQVAVGGQELPAYLLNIRIRA